MSHRYVSPSFVSNIQLLLCQSHSKSVLNHYFILLRVIPIEVLDTPPSSSYFISNLDPILSHRSSLLNFHFERGLIFAFLAFSIGTAIPTSENMSSPCVVVFISFNSTFDLIVSSTHSNSKILLKLIFPSYIEILIHSNQLCSYL